MQGEARRTASILHQTPGWRWRRELCLTERTQQCQSGPTTKAWFHDRCNRVDRDACRRGNVMTRVRHRQSTLRGAVPQLERNACRRGNVGRMRGIVRGTCGEHCGSCMEIGGACGWLVSKNLEGNAKRHAGSIGSTQVAASEPERVAPPDGVVWTSAGSTARKRHLGECGKHHRSWTVLSFVYCQSTTTEGCHGTELD